jgi:hypothetical protein
LGSKGSATHEVAVIGDTVGDTLNNTADSSFHIVIKLLNTISLASYLYAVHRLIVIDRLKKTLQIKHSNADYARHTGKDNHNKHLIT